MIIIIGTAVWKSEMSGRTFNLKYVRSTCYTNNKVHPIPLLPLQRVPVTSFTNVVFENNTGCHTHTQTCAHVPIPCKQSISYKNNKHSVMTIKMMEIIHFVYFIFV